MSAHTYLPTIADVATVFEEECRARGADAVESYDDERRLIARAVFGPRRAVQPGDAIHGGVALRVDGPEMFVHPYTWRQVCTNGAIAPLVLGTHRIERIEVDVTVASAVFAGGTIDELRLAIQMCSSPERLEESVDLMRSAMSVDGALAISVLHHLVHLRSEAQREFLLSTLDRHSTGGDPSAFGVFNAVTSVARDTADPDLRWRLELLGGQVLKSAVTHAVAHPVVREISVSA